MSPTTDSAIAFLPAGTFTGLRLPALVTAAERRALIARLEALGFEPTGRDYPDGYRNNDRVVLDDGALAGWLYERARARLPAELVVDGARWRIDGLNPRFRACRYRDGQRFCIHRDGPHVPSDEVRSWLTLQLYLNDGGELAGGRTRFYADAGGAEPWAAIEPVGGTAIAFDHRAWHDGEAVERGTKLVLRTDVMYRRDAAAPSAADGAIVIGRHRGYVWRVVARRDGSVASSGRDGTVRLWSSSVRAADAVHDLASGSVTALAEAADGQLWCGTRSGELFTIDPGGARRRHRLGASILDVAALADGGVAAALSSGELVGLARSGDLRWRRAVHQGWTWAVAARGRGLVSVGDDGRVQELDGDGGPRCVADLGVALRAVAVIGAEVLAGDRDGVVHRLAANGARIASARAHDAAITALAVGAATAWASAGEDGRVRLWRDDRCVATWTSDDFVRAVAIAPSGAVVWGGYDGTICTSEHQSIGQTKRGPTAPSEIFSATFPRVDPTTTPTP